MSSTPRRGSPSGKDASGKITKWRTSLWFGSGYNRQGGGQGYYADDVSPPPKRSGSLVNYNPFSVRVSILFRKRKSNIPARISVNGCKNAASRRRSRVHEATDCVTGLPKCSRAFRG